MATLTQPFAIDLQSEDKQVIVMIPPGSNREGFFFLQMHSVDYTYQVWRNNRDNDTYYLEMDCVLHVDTRDDANKNTRNIIGGYGTLVKLHKSSRQWHSLLKELEDKISKIDSRQI